jgi:hypothetical protein
MKGGYSYSISHCICSVCGLDMPIPRKKSRKREFRHIKDMYCCNCKCERKFIEIREQDFCLPTVNCASLAQA